MRDDKKRWNRLKGLPSASSKPSYDVKAIARALYAMAEPNSFRPGPYGKEQTIEAIATELGALQHCSVDNTLMQCIAAATGVATDDKSRKRR